MPINLICPHCGLENPVDQNAGQNSVCAGCGKALTIPASPGATPDAQPKGRLLTLVNILSVLFVLAVVAFLVALLIPSVDSRPAPRRAQCLNNITQIGLAILNYEHANGHFPPAFIADANGKPMHSWRVLILPYLEKKDLYEQYRMDEPWNSPHNTELAARMPAVYHCPSDRSATATTTSYAMLVGPHAFSDGPTGRKLTDITDGASNTIMVVEAVGEEINWLEPRDVDAEKVTSINRNHSGEPSNRQPGISSRHAGIAVAVFCDGHVYCLDDDMAPKVLRALITIDGGEIVDESDLNF